MRGRSRWSRNAPGGIQTVGSVPFCCSRLSPRTSSRSVLLISPHHQLRLAGVHELGHAAGGLNLVDDPIPIADRLHGDRGARLTSGQKLLERSALMREPLFADELTIRPRHRRQGVMLVGIERDIFHVLRLLSRLTPSSVVQRPR